MSELKNCPFCGYEPETKEVHVYPNGEKSPAFIKCKRCNYHLFSYNEEGLFVHWNCRPTENALRDEIERLRKALEKIAERCSPQRDREEIALYWIECEAREALEVKG